LEQATHTSLSNRQVDTILKYPWAES